MNWVKRRSFGLLFLSFVFSLFPLAIFSPASGSPCERISLGGPWVFFRQSGKPHTETVSFSIANPANQFLLRIINGAGDGSHRVSSSWIKLNGVQVAGPPDFNQQVALIEREVTLLSNNTLQVKLASAPGSFITVYIMGNDVLAPVISIIEPANGSLVETSVIEVRGTVDDNAATVTVNGIAASVENGNFLAQNMPLITGENTLSAEAVDSCGNRSSDTITVTLVPLTIDVTSPEEGALVYSDLITVRGTVSRSGAVVTVNGIPAMVSGNNFTAENIPLTPGPNSITAAASYNTITATDTVTVTLLPLTITITSPTEGQEFTNQPITVTGTVSRSTASVTVNGIAATVTDNNFTAENVPLTAGANTVTALAEDGEKTALASITVTLRNIDLEPVHVEIMSLMQDPQDLKVFGELMVTVVNNGGEDVTGSYKVTLFEDSNVSGAYEVGVDAFLGEEVVGSGPNSGGSINVPIALSGDILFRGNAIHVLVDSDDQQVETNEANNLISTRPPGIDLSASYLRLDDTGCPNRAVLAVRIGNSGGLAVNSGVPVAYYDGDPDQGGELIGTVLITQVLEPGEYEDVSVSWEDPLPGTRSIYARADDDGEGGEFLGEINEANNVVVTELSICTGHPTPDSDSISGYVINAVTGSPLSNVEVVLHEDDNGNPGTVIAQFTTEENGWFIFANLDPGAHFLGASSLGYIETTRLVVIASGEILTNQNLVLSPDLGVSEVRSILTWGATPEDLEAHLTAPNPQGCRYHCFYWNRTIPGASLDTDDRDSYGPETITISEIHSGTYCYYVHDWSNRLSKTSQALSTSGAEVKVYIGSEAEPLTFTVPAGKGTVWHVFDLEGDTGEIVPINRMTFQENPGEIDFPRITSNPITIVNAGSSYTYQVEAEDPDPDSLTFTLLTGPEGMSFDPDTGMIEWTPSVTQGGKHLISLKVSDGRCGVDTQEFEIDVSYRPVITSFTVEPCSGVNPGGNIILSWDSLRAESCVIDQGIGEVSLKGSLSVPSPDEPALYTITAMNGAGETKRTIPRIPEVVLFTADPRFILPGESASLSWKCQCAATVTIEPEVGEVDEKDEGTIPVTPQTTTTYTITATNGAGFDRRMAGVSTDPQASISADPDCDWNYEDRVTLQWEASGATFCRLDPGIGEVPLSGSIMVTPTEPTTYILIAEGPGGEKSASVDIPPLPIIDYFRGNPWELEPGENCTLSWNTQCADTCTLTPGIGEVEPGGSITVIPGTSPATYTLTVTNERRIITKTVTIRYCAPEVNFSVSPGVIKEGESATLSWATRYATACSITPGIGSVDLNGSIPVSPGQTTTYTLKAEGSGGVVEKKATVAFLKPTVSIMADPDFIGLGNSSTLTWVISNADTAYIDQGIGEVQPGGSAVVSPDWTTTYTITAAGPGGSAMDSVTVTVLNLSIDYPADGAILFTQPITVAGKVADPTAPVWVNGIQATVTPNGVFEAQGISLQEGINTISASTEKNGKAATAQITVTLNSEGCRGSDVPVRYPTIQAAINAAVPGQVIIVCPGTYRGNLDFKGKAITVVSRDGAQATFLQGTGTLSVVRFFQGEQATSVLKGFTITSGAGGIACSQSSPTIEDCIITGNESAASGGGIYCYESASPRIIHCTITGNQASFNGGGIYCSDGSEPRIENCIIRANTAGWDAGGIYCYRSSPILINTVISNNQALQGDGGGLSAQYYCDLHITHCTVTRNTARYGDGLYFYFGCDPVITNSIIWNESALYAIAYSDAQVSFSDIKGGWAGAGNLNLDPLFLDPDNGDFHLQAGSPCIDTGSDTGLVERDLDGEKRPIGAGVDMGADEYYGGPELEIIAPIDGQVVTTGLINILGTVNTDDLTVTVNGEMAAIENHEFLLEGLILTPGENVIIVVAEDLYGDTKTGEIQITYDPDTVPTIRINSPAHGDTITALPVSVNGICGENVVTVTINGQPAEVENGTFMLGALTLLRGNQTITARAYDAEGTLLGVDMVTVRVELLLRVDITSPSDGETVTTNLLTVRGTVNDAEAQVTINGTPVIVDKGIFQSEVRLRPGTNTIKAQATMGSETAQDEIAVIYYVPGSLTVTIETPENGETIDLASPPEITVAGTVNVADTAVTVNGQPASVDGAGNFTYPYTFSEGTNNITVQAVYMGDIARDRVTVFYGAPSPLDVTIADPHDGDTFDEFGPTSILVSVWVNNFLASVTINGESAELGFDGLFHTDIDLEEGTNLIVARAEYEGKTVNQVIRVYYGNEGDEGCGESGGDFSLTITSPEDGQVTRDRRVSVEGTVEYPEAMVWVNGEQALVDEGGNFRGEIWLWDEGRNEVTVQAEYEGQSAEAKICVYYGSSEEGLNLVITNPPDGETVPQDSVLVEGVVSNPAATVTVNGSPISVDGDGLFSTTVTLNVGQNLITAEAEYEGKTASDTVTVYYEPLPILTVEITSPQDGAKVYTPQITVSGEVSDATALVDVNGVAAGVTSGVFSAHNIPLTPGPNTLTATARRGEDTATDTITIIYEAPLPIKIESPTDGATTYDPTVTVSGTVSSGGVTVTANGVDATVENGRFTAENIPLTEGVNTITAIATDNGRTGSDSITITYINPLTISITYPAEGASIDFNETVVMGTVTSILPEFLVKVNGVLSEINGNTFVATGVSLANGTNILKATAVDTEGHSRSAQVTVNTSVARDLLVELDTDITSGVAPLETTFYLNYSYPEVPGKIISAAMDWEGDGTNDYTPTSTQFTHTYSSEGIYFPRVTLTDDLGNVYQDLTCINVIPMPNLEQIWEDMKAKLLQGDIQGALEYFSVPSRTEYEEIFNILIDDLSDIVTGMEPIERIYVKENIAKYRIKKDEEMNGETYRVTYYIYFVKDAYGIWYIDSF